MREFDAEEAAAEGKTTVELGLKVGDEIPCFAQASACKSLKSLMAEQLCEAEKGERLPDQRPGGNRPQKGWTDRR